MTTTEQSLKASNESLLLATHAMAKKESTPPSLKISATSPKRNRVLKNYGLAAI
jgi:hypothetical protein